MEAAGGKAVKAAVSLQSSRGGGGNTANHNTALAYSTAHHSASKHTHACPRAHIFMQANITLNKVAKE